MIGLNINPATPTRISNELLQKSQFLRLVISVDASRRSVEDSKTYYRNLFSDHKQRGFKGRYILIFNQETLWGTNPGWITNAWAEYSRELAGRALTLLQGFGLSPSEYIVQVWNEPDIEGASSIAMTAENYSLMLVTISNVIRASLLSPPLIATAGFANGAHNVVEYANKLNPASYDILCVHPYGQYVGNGPPAISTGWFGKIADYYLILERGLRTKKSTMVTEIGVAHHDFPQSQWKAIAEYLEEMYTFFKGKKVSGVVWFAHNDGMEWAGIVKRDGQPKEPIYQIYMDVVNSKPTPPTPPTPVGDGVRLTRKVGYSNIRVLPDLTARIVGRLTPGQVVVSADSFECVLPRLSRNERWWVRVTYEGQVAYVAGWLVDIV